MIKRCLSAGAVFAAIALSGCASQQIEPEGVDVHPSHSASGAAWLYRNYADAEPIITGTEGATIQGTLQDYQSIWRGLPGRGARIRVTEDNISEVLVITLDRTALAKDNPFRGGINNWWFKQIYPRLLSTAETAYGSRTGQHDYSIHLASRTTERSLLHDRNSEAQLKLRHLASWLMEDGIDPRLITGQVVESEGANRVGWELAVVIRPHGYGRERTAQTLLPAWLY